MYKKIVEMLKDNIPALDIASYLNIPVEQVRAIAEDLTVEG